MRNKIHTFRAATMDEALNLVQQQLGHDFVVVDSKEIPKHRLFPWPATQHEVEISAEQVSDRPMPKPQAALDSMTSPSSRMIRTLAESMPKPEQIPTLLDPIPDFPDETILNEILPQISNESSHDHDDIAKPAIVSVNESHPLEDVSTQFDYRKSLESLQLIVSQLERQSRPLGLNDISNELFQQYQRLVDSDVEDPIARDLISKLRRQASADVLKSPNSMTTMLTAMIEREIRCAPPIKPQTDRRQIVSLVGPTGVGKTTTLAKLAGHFQFNAGFRVGMISVDSCRVGAAEQLQAYADILQIPLHSVSEPDELRTAIDELDDVDLVLIDTAGRSPFNPSKMNDLNSMLQVASSHHVLLVLSMAAGPKMLSAIAQQFAVVQPTSLVLTKLDEIQHCGGLLSVARDIPHPVSYLATGVNVPEQIEPAHPTRMARLILGRDQINQDPETLPELL